MFKVKLWTTPMQVHFIDSLYKAIDLAASHQEEADICLVADDFPLAEFRYDNGRADGDPLGWDNLMKDVTHPSFEENKWRLHFLTSPQEIAGLKSIMATTEKLCALRCEQKVSQR